MQKVCAEKKTKSEVLKIERRHQKVIFYEKGVIYFEKVQKILGHEQIDTTLKYAVVNQNNVKLSHRKYIS